MEAITTIAKMTKKGHYSFSITGLEEKELDIIIVKNKKTKPVSKTGNLSRFIGKFSNKIDWNGYQKKIRNEWI